VRWHRVSLEEFSMAVTTTTPFYVAGAWEEGGKPLEIRYPYDDHLVGTTS